MPMRPDDLVFGAADRVQRPVPNVSNVRVKESVRDGAIWSGFAVRSDLRLALWEGASVLGRMTRCGRLCDVCLLPVDSVGATIGGVRPWAGGSGGGYLTKTGVVFALAVAACSPVEGAPPDLAAVESHLDLLFGYIPEGCDPVGLDGDGRGRMVGAAFDCLGDTTLRVERFDAEFNNDPLPASPAETVTGRVEWRDHSTGDVIRVVSDDLDVEMLIRLAESIDVD